MIDNVSEVASDRSSMSEFAQTKADMYGFLAMLFNTAPDESLLTHLKRWRQEDYQKPSPNKPLEKWEKGYEEMADFLGRVDNRENQELQEILAVDWTRLFRGVRPGYGPPPPYESLYLSGGRENNKDMMAVFSCLARLYREEGAAINWKYANRPDYIGLELGFLALLAEREAKCLENNEFEKAEIYLSRSEEFVEAHVSKWVPCFCSIAEKEAETGFYRGILRVTRGLINKLA